MNSYHRMEEIDAELDDYPDLSIDLVKLDNRNLLAHNELLQFEKNHTFLYRHPLAAEQKFKDSTLSDLEDLRKNNPEAFLLEIANVTQNIRRIKSNLNKKKYKSDEERNSWEENLSRAERRSEMLRILISKK